MAKNYIINNVLSFLCSAKNDYAEEALFDVIYSFYSIDEIKVSKNIIAGILNKDAPVRRDPDKKKKELSDLIQFYDEFLLLKNNKDVFVSDNYKKVPPLGLEFIAPMLCNLSEEVSKINELLPKILDIRSEVSNTADTVRNLKANITNVEEKIVELNTSYKTSLNQSGFNYGSSCVPISNRYDVLDNGSAVGDSAISCSLTQSSVKKAIADYNSLSVSPGLGNHGNTLTPTVSRKTSRTHDKTLSPLSTGALKGNIVPSFQDAPVPSSITNKYESVKETTIHEDDSGNDGWTLVQREKRNNYKKSNRKTSIIRGSGQNFSNNILKGVDKLVDIYVGRINIVTDIDVISSFIKDNFEVTPINVELLDIKSTDYKCYKVKIKLNERNLLFNPSLWPVGVVIDKFYNKSFRK